MTTRPNPRRPFAALGAALGAAAILGAALATALPVPQAGAGTQAILQAAAIRNYTPACRNYPNAPVKGYVVGLSGVWPTRTFSFVGCFDSLAACERWRRPTAAFIEQRFIQNRCEVRR